MFTISLKHVGNGRFWEPGSLAYCGPYTAVRPDPRREDVVYLLDARMSGDIQKLYCSPRNDNDQVSLRFQNGVAQVNCLYRQSSAAVQTRTAYSSALTLEFGYLYQNTIRKNVVIHRT
jgi:GTP cyclohydrolase III